MANMDICLDAGHYGKYNRSPVIPAYYESEMNWKLTMLQKKYLEEYGFRVILTREDPAKDLDLVERGKKAKGCCLFISNHSNAAETETPDYVAVYHLTEDSKTDIDDLSKDLAKKIAPGIASMMGTKQGYKVISRKAGGDRNGDGVLNDNYYGVLHGARLAGVPGLILEHSFHTNKKATEWLMDDSNLDKMARYEAATIAAFKGVEKPVENVEKPTVKVGDVVTFTGSRHYVSANSGTGKACTPGKARVTAIYKPGDSKHPYHLKRVTGGGSTVYGWVDAEDIEGLTTAPPAADWTPAAGDVVNFTGTSHYRSADSTTRYICRPGLAVITKVYRLGKSKHPYHLERVTGGGSTVYGWVDADTFTKA